MIMSPVMDIEIKKLLIRINCNMKNRAKISFMLILLLMATSFSLSAQRGMRGMRADTAGMNRMMMHQRQMPVMGHPDSSMMRGMQHGMAPMRMHNMGQFMYPMWQMWQPGPGMRGMGPGMGMMNPGFRRPGMGMNQAPGVRLPAPGMRIMDNIPNLSEKQKKEIADLRQKQLDEMQKLRSEMQAKMKALRDSHRANVMSLLTDEQKKWVEEHSPAPAEK